MAFDREAERSICGNVDDSEAVAFSRLNVNSGTNDLRAAIVSTDTVYQAGVGYLAKFS